MLDNSSDKTMAPKLTLETVKQMRDIFNQHGYEQISPFHQAWTEEQEKSHLRRCEDDIVEVRKFLLKACPEARPGSVAVIVQPDENKVLVFAEAMKNVAHQFNALQAEADEMKCATVETAKEFAVNLDKLLMIARRDPTFRL